MNRLAFLRSLIAAPAAAKIASEAAAASVEDPILPHSRYGINPIERWRQEKARLVTTLKTCESRYINIPYVEMEQPFYIVSKEPWNNRYSYGQYQFDTQKNIENQVDEYLKFKYTRQSHAKLIPVRRNGKPFVLKSTNPLESYDI